MKLKYYYVYTPYTQGDGIKHEQHYEGWSERYKRIWLDVQSYNIRNEKYGKDYPQIRPFLKEDQWI